ncbi:MAG: hypothetical protein D6784_02460, partial [Chloroflexi bacterium]
HDHHTDPQDMRNMGGLYSKMKASFWAYLFGTLALVGIFPFAGFWSKDEILAEAYLHGFGEHGDPLAFWVYVAGAVGALFTAFYMGRQIGLVFFGKPRTELAAHAHEPGKRMTWPLLVLAVFALLFGFVNVPENFPLIGNGWLHGFVGEVHLIAEEAAPGIAFKAVPFNWTVAISSTIIGLLSFAAGWWIYSRVQSADEPDPIQRIPVVGRPIFTILYNKYYFDEIYRGLLIYPTVSLANFCAKFDYDWVINRIVDFFGSFTRILSDGVAVFDQTAIDGYFVNGIPGLFNWFGGQLRLLQTGRVQNYMIILLIGLLILLGIYLALWSGQAPGLASL